MPGRRALQAVDGLADPVSGACNIGRLAQTRAFRSGLSDPPRMSVWRLLASSDPGARLALPVLANVRARAPRQREPCSSVDALLVQSQMGAAPDGALSTLARPHQEWALSRPALPQHLDERGQRPGLRCLVVTICHLPGIRIRGRQPDDCPAQSVSDCEDRCTRRRCCDSDVQQAHASLFDLFGAPVGPPVGFALPLSSSYRRRRRRSALGTPLAVSTGRGEPDGLDRLEDRFEVL